MSVSFPPRALPSTGAASAPGASGGGAQLLGESLVIQEVRRLIARFANLRQPVLIHGETGTGKEVVATLLHQQSQRKHASMVTVNCGAIPHNLAESELFGHERGAFTGAHRPHRGAFARANGGTLFLDEIGELALPVQAKLLRVLETGVVVPVGGEREEKIDVRVVAATHRDLWLMVDEGEFREDLLHRLSVLDIHLPALRERPSDIVTLVRHFAHRCAVELGRPIDVMPAALAAAQRHAWPGNVRALKNAITRAAVLHEGPIGPEELLPAIERAARPNGGMSCAKDEIRIPRGDYATMKRALLQAVLVTEGSIRKAALKLNVPRSTLGAWLKDRMTIT